MKKTLITALILLGNCSYAIDMSIISPVNPLDKNKQYMSSDIIIPSFDLKRATLSKNSLKNQYTIAMNKFMQSNIRSSYSDFKILIDSVTPNDYVYLRLAKEMASVGFFSLSELSMSKIQDDSISSGVERDIKNFYFPSSSLNYKDQIYLAEMYSNIMYNDQSKEASTELKKQSSLLADSDYANYLVALGSIKSNNKVQAKEYIDKAISMNPKNINYKILKAEIISQSDNMKSALNYIKEIQSLNFNTVIFDQELHSASEYVLYKSSKNDYVKKYHLAHYYYDKGELNKSLGVLQTAISSKKNINKDVYALTAQVYYDMQEYEKSLDYAQKSLNIDKSNFGSLIVSGDVYMRNKNYSEAQKYYKRAIPKEKNYIASLKLANIYQIQNDLLKAKNIYSKILKTSSTTYEAYYKMALLEKDRELSYIKKALSINPNFIDGWIDLARISIESNDYENASSLLGIAKYIDENNCRYYYYYGLILKNKGLISEAESSFKKSLDINPNYDLAKKELSI